MEREIHTVPADVRAANAAYVSSLTLPPLAATQAARVRAVLTTTRREQEQSAAA
ncbi:hypothetical protein ACFUMH_04150 [Cellulomonas sp. NPDC057328]|uniref:hypothetical protein n=1 Tax=Cellulomonas sp. NPDC057328 TaxID=3346101 RepID=UPI0036430A67